jgi:hypothetical protein
MDDEVCDYEITIGAISEKAGTFAGTGPNRTSLGTHPTGGLKIEGVSEK